MKQNTYGKEAFNLRLTVLRMVTKWPLLLGLILLGTLLWSQAYYVKTVVLYDDDQYITTASFHVEYAVDSESQIGMVYINEASWNTFVQTDVFQEALKQELPADMPSGYDASHIKVYVASDLRVPSVEIITDQPKASEYLLQAFETVMMQKVPGILREVESVALLDDMKYASSLYPVVQMGKAYALGAVLSGFFVIVVFLLRETWMDALWLPSSLWKRYGIPAVGTLQSKALAENIRHLFADKKKVAVCPVTKETDPAQMLQSLKDNCGDEQLQDWYPVPAPALSPEVCKELREAEGILLVIESGIRGNAVLEPVLEYLQQQECNVTAAIMADADERLLRAYYCLGKDEG